MSLHSNALPVVSVLVCTSSPERATAAVQSICTAIASSAVPAELVLVENCSAVTASCKLLAKLSVDAYCVREPRIGKGFAYNAGLRSARGRVVLFTDDDVVVPSTWVDGMCADVLGGRADAVAGGVTLGTVQEATLRREGIWKLRPWFASSDGMDPKWPGTLIGANMAIGRHVFDRIGGFDPALGPGAIGFGDETELAGRMLRAGMRIVARPDVRVVHEFDVDRLSGAALYSLARRMGETTGYLSWHAEGIRMNARRLLLTEIPYVLPRLAVLPLLLPFRRDARAPWLHLQSTLHRIRRHIWEQRLPRRMLGAALGDSPNGMLEAAS